MSFLVCSSLSSGPPPPYTLDYEMYTPSLRPPPYTPTQPSPANYSPPPPYPGTPPKWIPEARIIHRQASDLSRRAGFPHPEAAAMPTECNNTSGKRGQRGCAHLDLHMQGVRIPVVRGWWLNRRGNYDYLTWCEAREPSHRAHPEWLIVRSQRVLCFNLNRRQPLSTSSCAHQRCHGALMGWVRRPHMAGGGRRQHWLRSFWQFTLYFYL